MRQWILFLQRAQAVTDRNHPFLELLQFWERACGVTPDNGHDGTIARFMRRR